MPQVRAVLTPISDSPASRVEVSSSLSRSTSGQHSVSPGPWLVFPHGVSHRKWTHSRRVRRSPEKSGLDFVKEQLATPRQSYDVDTLLHVHQQSVHAAQDSHWLRLVTVVACSVTVILLLVSCYELVSIYCGQDAGASEPVPPQARPREVRLHPTPCWSTGKLGHEARTHRDQSYSQPTP